MCIFKAHPTALNRRETGETYLLVSHPLGIDKVLEPSEMAVTPPGVLVEIKASKELGFPQGI